MSNIKENALAYMPKQTKNIADLEKVSVELDLEDRDGTDSDGKPFYYKVLIIDGEEYRVPGVVLGDLKTHLEANPELTHFKVIRKGTGKSTKYTVIPVSGEASASSPSYPKVMDVMMPHNSDAQKKAYADMLQTKAVLHDKFLLGMLTAEQHAEMVSLAHEEYSSKCQ